ncbi:phenylacetate--CoA ligase family protein [Mesonia ostreae]|uniref:Phenylacetate-CoA ligase n=1 Tax=Mesonia ostreae TaxID=861110 RepID=A0ABU2KH62_9FLAO|nr:hypothetical protein [Mesonia ostreae]MDT0294042.1 hypothetical protein [Mesonia ostreae]
MSHLSSFSFILKNTLLRNKAIQKYKVFKENDLKSKKDLELLNWEKRKNIVYYAYENIPFYKEWYNKHNFHPDQLKVQNDWDLVPIITKEDIRDNYNKIINPNFDQKRHIVSSTGGTSGAPLKVLHDKNNYNDVNGWRVMKWWNLSISPNIAFVFRLTRSSKMNILLNKLMWFPTKRIFLDASSVNDKKIEKFISQLIENKTIVLQGYTGALNEVANYVLKNRIKVGGIQAVWCTSSPLTKKIRNNLKSAFDAEVYDQYGSGEVYWIATECDHHDGLHVHSDIRHVDIIDDKDNSVKNSTLGNLAITDLDNYLFPIIKYKNGDLSLIKKENCGCGKPYPLLEKIYGRTTDLVKLPNGGFIAGDYFTTIFDDYPDEVDGFQVHQKTDYSIDINIKSKGELNNKIIKNIKSIINQKTNNIVSLRVNEVEEINNNSAGKNRFVISDIQ